MVRKELNERKKEISTLSHSLEDYLEAIFIINIDKKVVRVKELARHLKVKTPSVVDAVSKLKKKGLVNHEKYGYLSLSKEGFHVAKSIYDKHGYIYKFLNEVLGVDEDNSEKDACGMEHYVSEATLDGIINFMDFIENNAETYSELERKYKRYMEINNTSKK